MMTLLMRGGIPFLSVFTAITALCQFTHQQRGEYGQIMMGDQQRRVQYYCLRFVVSFLTMYRRGREEEGVFGRRRGDALGFYHS